MKNIDFSQPEKLKVFYNPARPEENYLVRPPVHTNLTIFSVGSLLAGIFAFFVAIPLSRPK